MSIVGPRPHAVAHNEQYRQLIKAYMVRHKVKPGITGWAQVNGQRGETDTIEKMQARVEYDLEYLRNWSLGLDLQIIVAHHPPGVLRPPCVLTRIAACGLRSLQHHLQESRSKNDQRGRSLRRPARSPRCCAGRRPLGADRGALRRRRRTESVLPRRQPGLHRTTRTSTAVADGPERHATRAPACSAASTSRSAASACSATRSSRHNRYQDQDQLNNTSYTHHRRPRLADDRATCRAASTCGIGQILAQLDGERRRARPRAANIGEYAERRRRRPLGRRRRACRSKARLGYSERRLLGARVRDLELDRRTRGSLGALLPAGRQRCGSALAGAQSPRPTLRRPIARRRRRLPAERPSTQQEHRLRWSTAS